MGRRLVVEADGGSRGNPGIAGYGALVKDATGTLLAERAEPLGQVSNNVAEYRGLIAGLTAAAEIDPAADVLVRMDSKLVVEQLSGRWKIKHEDMRALAGQARELASAIIASGGSVSYTWIPRQDNRAADALSNDGMDGKKVHRDHWRDQSAEPPRTPRRETTRIVLVRHGVTAFTEDGRLDGRGGADPPLSPLGAEQARRAADAVAHLVGDAPATVITSALARAKQTGQIIAQRIGAGIETDADFDEQNFGDWDGARMADLLTTSRGDFLRLRDDAGYARPGGESHDQLLARVLPAYERVVARGGLSVIATHRRPILIVLAHLLGMPHDRAWRLLASPGSLTAIEITGRGDSAVIFTNRT